MINKIDLPSADPERVKQEVEEVIGMPREECILASAKEGIGTQEILEAVIKQIPPPQGQRRQSPTRAGFRLALRLLQRRNCLRAHH